MVVEVAVCRRRSLYDIFFFLGGKGKREHKGERGGSGGKGGGGKGEGEWNAEGQGEWKREHKRERGGSKVWQEAVEEVVWRGRVSRRVPLKGRRRAIYCTTELRPAQGEAGAGQTGGLQGGNMGRRRGTAFRWTGEGLGD
ncbi:unnamed protein product [Chondrus crispus]|uniref:Uncharacterized protein n=1 Tax=Chondrus crispus TaxID=2769 RepID=R7QM92_CHOCR|nr:unnamed protein product [Chondrus crispus]CDF38485.1 unnamed protein product [Chondrus crispus]|eukprot:XP_005718378.1 unnamed protein product [Chondrus crispus]